MNFASSVIISLTGIYVLLFMPIDAISATASLDVLRSSIIAACNSPAVKNSLFATAAAREKDCSDLAAIGSSNVFDSMFKKPKRDSGVSAKSFCTASTMSSCALIASLVA